MHGNFVKYYFYSCSSHATIAMLASFGRETARVHEPQRRKVPNRYEASGKRGRRSGVGGSLSDINACTITV